MTASISSAFELNFFEAFRNFAIRVSFFQFEDEFKGNNSELVFTNSSYLQKWLHQNYEFYHLNIRKEVNYREKCKKHQN